jgi:N-acetyl-anhydromuramyl-L-alanine amidase AmpD
VADYTIEIRDKRLVTSAGQGYQLRGTVPTAIVIHSTSNPNAKNTAFENELKFLLTTTKAASHYLIGKDGRIVQMLEPRAWQAWHAGEALVGFTNPRSIGIELHHSVGDPPYPAAQLDALAWLVRRLMAQFSIPAERVETHGQIARPGPYGRKTDPSDMTYSAFLAWRAGLSDPFDRWGVIGRPSKEQEGWATPKAWLVNKRLGACVSPETYSTTGRYSVTEFEYGIITYFKQRNVALVELF